MLSWITAHCWQWFAAGAGKPVRELRSSALYGGLLQSSSWLALCGRPDCVLTKKLIAAVGLRPADRMLGAAFGLVRGIIILLALTVVVGMTRMRSAQVWQEIHGRPYCQRGIDGPETPVLPQRFHGKYLPS